MKKDGHSLFMRNRLKTYTTSAGSHRERLRRVKNHPFIVPVVTFMVLFFVSLIGFVIFGGGSTVGPTDSYVVNVYADGNSRTLPTRAKTVSELLDRMDVKVSEGDVVEPSLDSPILQDNFNVNVYRARELMIIDNGKRTIIKSADQSPRIAARKAGIVVYPEDNVVPEAPDNILEEGVVGERYVVNRATPVTLILYGSVTAVRTQVKTVGDLVKDKQIETSPEDTITPSLETPLTPDMQVVVTRVGQQIQTVEEAIPPPQETTDDPNLAQGQTVVREAGAPGKRIATYEVKIENGAEVSRTKIQEIVAVQPLRQLVARGTKIIISNPSENVKVGERMAAAQGWTGEQWYCLYQLWQKESGWRTNAGNTSSGAYGIPQALPGSKMASSGSDWLTNPATQIAWGIGYIKGRYASPCAAWATSQSRGWY